MNTSVFCKGDAGSDGGAEDTNKKQKKADGVGGSKKGKKKKNKPALISPFQLASNTFIGGGVDSNSAALPGMFFFTF